MNWHPDQSWTLFLDRDGVINKRLMEEYVRSVDEFELIDGVAEAIRIASGIFGTIIVVTNQQGIGKGLMTERNLSDIHAYCLQMIKTAGGKIDRFYFAPDLSGNATNMRKPGIGMGLQAQVDFPRIDFSKSVMIGDAASDMEFGKKLGMKTVFVATETTTYREADLTARSLLEAIKKITV